MKLSALAMPDSDLMQKTEIAIERVEGPSFPLAVKVFATGVILALLVYGWRAFTGASDARVRDLGAGEWGFLAAVCVVIGSGYWGILTSRTSCDSQHIEQTWIWRKRVNIADITQIKLISIPGLAWIVVPRLVVRAGFGLTTFHAGDPAVLSRFRLLAYGA